MLEAEPSLERYQTLIDRYVAAHPVIVREVLVDAVYKFGINNHKFGMNNHKSLPFICKASKIPLGLNVEPVSQIAQMILSSLPLNSINYLKPSLSLYGIKCLKPSLPLNGIKLSSIDMLQPME